MRIAVFLTFATIKGEPLAAHLARVHDGFVAAGLGEPLVQFHFSDGAPITNAAVLAEIGGDKRVSSVARVLKRVPDLKAFIRAGKPTPDGGSVIRALSNVSEAGIVEPVPFATLLEIAGGVPKSFPFHVAQFQFFAEGFSEGPEPPPMTDPRQMSMLMRAGVDIGAGAPTRPGIGVKDSWWVNGRQRAMTGLRVVEADPGAKTLPPPPAAVAAVLAACGKIRKTVQVPMIGGPEPDAAEPKAAASAPPVDFKSTPTGQLLLELLRRQRAGLRELAEGLPHDPPPRAEEPSVSTLSPSGPKKPELERWFKPLGYGCRGETGTFTLRRRGPGNLIVELRLDVGTWSGNLSAHFAVGGMIDGVGFRLAMGLPPCRQASIGLVRGVEMVGQFPIGGPERWSQLVENLAALVTVLDRDFVPQVAAIAGPTPEWRQPRS
jgi:hypothetical protein